MKLEREMKRYYRVKLDGIKPPEIPELIVNERRPSLSRRITSSDMLLGALVNCTIAIVLVFGFFQYRQESVLAGVLSRHAETLSLDRYIDSRIQTLTEQIIIIRESNN